MSIVAFLIYQKHKNTTQHHIKHIVCIWSKVIRDAECLFNDLDGQVGPRLFKKLCCVKDSCYPVNKRSNLNVVQLEKARNRERYLDGSTRLPRYNFLTIY